MVFAKYPVANNARWQLNTPIASDTLSVILQSNQGDMFPDHNGTTDTDYPCTLVSFDVDLITVLKREIVLVTAKSWDTFTITRWWGTCIGADGETTQGNTQYAFDENDYFFMGVVAEVIEDIQNEVARLETDKADDSEVVHNTWNETIAWIKTFSSSPIVPDPTNPTDAANKDYVDNAAWALTDNSFMAGETISAGNCLYLERGYTFAQATGVQNIGDVTANTRVAIKVVWSWVAASTLKLSLKKTWTPAGNLNVRVETDSSWSPSWSTVTNGTGSVTAASLSTSLADTTVTLAGSITLNAGVTYWIVLYQGTYGAETISGSNYYNVWYNAVITERVGKLYNGSAWAVPATVTDNNGARWATDVNTSKVWLVIYSKYDQILQKVTKDANTTATTAYLYQWNDVVTTLVAVVAFSGNDATFNRPMAAGSYYTIAWDSQWASYNSARWSGSYPVNWTNVNITTWMWGNTTQYLWLASITTTNYLWWYAQSTAIESNLLFKTDADLAHKVPVALEQLRIAIEAAVAGDYVQHTVPWGLNKNVSWLTAWVEYFLSWTAGALSSTPWTYKYKAGIAISPTILFQNSKSLLSFIQAAWSSPYTYQNTTGVPVQLVINWGTVSAVAYSRDWTNYTTVATATNTQIVLQPYDYCKITYSSLPTLYINHY